MLKSFNEVNELTQKVCDAKRHHNKHIFSRPAHRFFWSYNLPGPKKSLS